MLLVESTVSAGYLASTCPGGAWQLQSRNPNFPTRHEQLPFYWLGRGRSSFLQTLFELLDRASRGWGWILSCGSAVSPAPLPRQARAVCGWQAQPLPAVRAAPPVPSRCLEKALLRFPQSSGDACLEWDPLGLLLGPAEGELFSLSHNQPPLKGL